MTATHREAERLCRLYGDAEAVPIEVWIALLSAVIHFVTTCLSDDPADVVAFIGSDRVDERRTRKRLNRLARRAGVPLKHRPAVVGLMMSRRATTTVATVAGLMRDEAAAKAALEADDTGEWPAVT